MCMSVAAAMTSKAGTLAALRGRLVSALVLEQRVLRVRDWLCAREQLLDSVLTHFGCSCALAVRSSAMTEDTHLASLAGRFASCLNVRGADRLAAAIDEVIASYGATVKPQDEVLIQPMVEATVLSGVATSCEPGSGRPYVIINYTESDDTREVSSGTSNTVRTFYVHRTIERRLPGPLGDVVALVRELEAVLGFDDLDIEFACPREGKPVLLQCRRLVNVRRCQARAAQVHRAALEISALRLNELQAPQPFVQGRRTAFGMMPDWNPAEMIGVRPRPLAYSLYRHLITDGAWAVRRARFGYRDLCGHRLMVDLLGLPLIDVRASFNSFVPAALPDALATKLVDLYLRRLQSSPASHDKVEFDIVHSCFTFATAAELERLAEAGFDASERELIAQALLDITRMALDPVNAPQHDDKADIDMLEARYTHLRLQPELPAGLRIHWLLEDCRRYGTLPFAGVARTAFIAFEMLRSMETVGILSRDEFEAFVASVNSVSRQARVDLCYGVAGFLKRYGHLRPGTYDIRTPRYDQAFDVYFRAVEMASVPTAPPSDGPHLSSAQQASVERFLRSHGFALEAHGLLPFIRNAIEERERAKLLFTRNLSDALSCIEQLGRLHGFDADDMSYASVNCILELPFRAAPARALLQEDIQRGRAAYRLTEQTIVPPLLFDGDDILAFHMPPSEPNFVTAGQCIGPVRSHCEADHLDDSIVAIPNADPGFDWIFTRNIKGLITAYGGANSHMAIRAAEAGIPAVIGAGDVLFQRWSQSKVLHIDCANRQVHVMH